MRNIFVFSVLLFFLVIGNNFGQAADNFKKPKIKRVSEAYGFIKGQQYSLDLIKKELPQFRMSILKAQTSFNSNFGKAKEEIKRYLAESLGQNDFNQYEQTLVSELEKMLGDQIFTEEIAANFITEVENRAKGNIVSTVLETLLSFQFLDRPQDEFTSGFTTIFKTKGHLKSKNTDWQIKVPKSWKAEEADRPNIIQKFTSDYGAGNQIIMLMVKDMPQQKGQIITMQELNRLFTEKEMKNMLPDGGKFISFTKMTFDNHIGGMMEIEQIRESLDFKVKIRMAQFMFIRDNKMYILQGMVSTDETLTDLSLEMKKYMPLYKLVANSIVVNDQYK